MHLLLGLPCSHISTPTDQWISSATVGHGSPHHATLPTAHSIPLRFKSFPETTVFIHLTYEQYCLHGRDTMHSGITSSKFRGNILPSSSGTKSTRSKQAEQWLQLTWLPTFRANVLPSSSGLRSKTIKQQSSLVMLAACCLLDLLFELEDGDSIFFWNVRKLLPDCTASHPRKCYSA
jgi:hypothetical protein